MSSSHTSPTRLSRTLGALLGVHAGDSLGATLEFIPWAEIQSAHPQGLCEIVGGGAFDWPVGHATDDTDLTRAVLLAYHDLEKHKHSAQSQSQDFNIIRAAADHSLNWLDGNWPGRKPGAQPKDIGTATWIGLSNYKVLRDPSVCGAGTGRAGNGSLMRCIPTALFVSDAEKRKKDSIAISAITHNDPRCTASCAAYNEIAFALVSGKTAAEAVDIGLTVSRELDCPAVVQAIERAKNMSVAKFANEGPGDVLPDKTSGFVLQSLMLGTAAVLDPRSFEDVLVDIVRIGGDTDTNGAIAGGLLGARDGVERIPERWLEVLQFRGEFERLAKGILEMQGWSSTAVESEETR